MATSVDVVILSRDERPINAEVIKAVSSQEGVEIRLYRVVGAPHPYDTHRWQTIARARNVGRTLGTSPWLMFVDDDVVLGRGCIARLLRDLEAKPTYVAMAADYLNEHDSRVVSKHVAMGATLFRKKVLSRIGFRWEKSLCECQCMVDDLRRRSMGIDYSASATATHLDQKEAGFRQHTADGGTAVEVSESRLSEVDSPTPPDLESEAVSSEKCLRAGNTGEHRAGEILVAFDRSHIGLFRGQFLSGLRESGNDSLVHAVTYGLRRRQIQALRRVDGVRVYPQSYTVHRVCRSRLFSFQLALRKLCPTTPVAYWDAGDVLFQASLNPLWDLVRRHSRKLLIVEEPLAFASNPGHQAWISSISDPAARRRTLSLLERKPVVNGGFVAGTAGRLLSYFETANRLINSELRGAGGGDQVVLNVCRYTRVEDFIAIDETWNYCLVGRSGRHCKIRQGKYLDVLRGRIVSVVHGNARTLV